MLKLRDVDQPSIGDDEVLVQVRAAGVGPGVWILMTGQPYLMRLMGFGLRRPKVVAGMVARSDIVLGSGLCYRHLEGPRHHPLGWPPASHN